MLIQGRLSRLPEQESAVGELVTGKLREYKSITGTKKALVPRTISRRSGPFALRIQPFSQRVKGVAQPTQFGSRQRMLHHKISSHRWSQTTSGNHRRVGSSNASPPIIRNLRPSRSGFTTCKS